jgi:hypothetical protein
LSYRHAWVRSLQNPRHNFCTEMTFSVPMQSRPKRIRPLTWKAREMLPAYVFSFLFESPLFDPYLLVFSISSHIDHDFQERVRALSRQTREMDIHREELTHRIPPIRPALTTNADSRSHTPISAEQRPALSGDQPSNRQVQQRLRRSLERVSTVLFMCVP